MTELADPRNWITSRGSRYLGPYHAYGRTLYDGRARNLAESVCGVGIAEYVRQGDRLTVKVLGGDAAAPLLLFDPEDPRTCPRCRSALQAAPARTQDAEPAPEQWWSK